VAAAPGEAAGRVLRVVCAEAGVAGMPLVGVVFPGPRWRPTAASIATRLAAANEPARPSPATSPFPPRPDRRRASGPGRRAPARVRGWRLAPCSAAA
jgi:hypothetical protein